MLRENPTCGCGDELICNEEELRCDPCCRCIPQRLCAEFTATDCECDGLTDLMPWSDIDQEYYGELQCGSELAEIHVLLHYENETCYWRVVIDLFEIDELFEIGPEKQSCEYPDLQLTVPFELCTGTVRITRHDFLKLPPRLLEDDCDEQPWCGTGWCACECLCVTIVEHLGGIGTGEVCNIAYLETEPPEWAGSISGYAIDITIARDEYTGACLLGGTINGEAIEWIEVDDLTNIWVTWTLSDYTEVSVTCKECHCEPIPTCGGCCWETDPADPTMPVPITFDIVAPDCTELNSASRGLSYVFVPQLSGEQIPIGACGPCTWMLWHQPSPEGTVGGYEYDYFQPSPCGWQLQAAIVCTAPSGSQEPTATSVPCCENVQLLMAADNEFSGSRPLTDFTTNPALALYAEAAQALIDLGAFWGRVQNPSSCSCSPVTGMHAVFPIDGWVSPACTETPPYAYACCEPTICNLSGATLQF
ncbi:MAG: hypothetical protein KDA85_22695 [Planctomycetaceae bacterium]|nr:hypothetical protein [Planctomycetaceae bacterium]